MQSVDLEKLEIEKLVDVKKPACELNDDVLDEVAGGSLRAGDWLLLI